MKNKQSALLISITEGTGLEPARGFIPAGTPNQCLAIRRTPPLSSEALAKENFISAVSKLIERSKDIEQRIYNSKVLKELKSPKFLLLKFPDL